MSSYIFKPFQNLLAEPASHEDHDKPGVIKKVYFKKGELLSSDIQMVNWATIKPNQSFKKHYHQDMEELFIIIKGTGIMQIENESISLNTNDAILVPPMTKHKLINNSNQDLDYLVVGFSKEGKGNTVTVE